MERDIRYCEYPKCKFKASEKLMIRAPGGEWYCPPHANRTGLAWSVDITSPNGGTYLEYPRTADELQRLIENIIDFEATERG